MNSDKANIATTAKAIGAFLAIVVGGVMYGSLFSAAGTEQSSKDNEIATPITMAQEFVKRQLKAPATASFPWSFKEYHVSKTIDGWRVSGYVDAVNRFNANVRTSWSVEMKDRGGSWEQTSIQFSSDP